MTELRPRKIVRLLMWEITSPLADRLFTISNAVLILGAAMVFIGTIGAIVLSGVREQFSNARISENETQTAQGAKKGRQRQMHVRLKHNLLWKNSRRRVF